MSNLSQFFGNSAKEVNVWADGATETRQYQVGTRNSFPFIPKTVGISNNRETLPIGPGKHYDSSGTKAAQGGGLHHFAGLWMHASAASATGAASIYTSPDGVVWTARASGFPYPMTL
jgi:aspartate oxidase